MGNQEKASSRNKRGVFIVGDILVLLAIAVAAPLLLFRKDDGKDGSTLIEQDAGIDNTKDSNRGEETPVATNDNTVSDPNVRDDEEDPVLDEEPDLGEEDPETPTRSNRQYERRQ